MLRNDSFLSRPVSDDAGVFVAEYVYKKLFKSGSDVINLDTIPYALDDAAQLLRKSDDYNAYEWATLVHMGA